MAKIYSWGFFFEDGNRAALEVPFGPEHPDNVIYSWDDPWMLKLLEIHPDLKTKADEMGLPFACVIVNPPVETSSSD